MWDALVALRDCLKAGIQTSDCKYNFIISRGEPPAEQCNQIALMYEGSIPSRGDNDDCCTRIYRTSFKVMLTRCCVQPDAGVNFDPKAEERETQCFLNDVCTIRNRLKCISTCTLHDHMMGCGLIVESISPDREPQGGCYSVTFRVSFVEEA